MCTYIYKYLLINDLGGRASEKQFWIFLFCIMNISLIKWYRWS